MQIVNTSVGGSGDCTGLIPDVTQLVRSASMDNCTDPMDLIITQLPAIGDPVSGADGTTLTVTVSVEDAHGNSTDCQVTIELNDDEAPIITNCPASDVVVVADPNFCGKFITQSVNITDNCDLTSVVATAPASIIPPIVNPLSSLYTVAGNFSVGTTEVTVTATDAGGNPSTCVFNVVVQDTQAPALQNGTCPGNITVSDTDGDCMANATWLAPIFSDNCGLGGGFTVSGDYTPGAAFPVGTTTVTYTATDGSPYSSDATCIFDVIVLDDHDPSITCPANISMPADPGLCEATVTFVAPVGTDNCSSVTTTQTDATGLSSGSVFPLGTTTLEFTATDGATNSSTCTIMVTVTSVPVAVDDVSLPSLPGSVTLNVVNNDTDCDNNIDVSTVDLNPSMMGQQIMLTVPGEGVWDVNAIGEVTFTPEVGFTLDPTPITYTVGDGSSFTSNTATIAIDYVPVAMDDLSNNNNAGPVEVDVLSNDTAGDLVDPMTVQIVGTASPGMSLMVLGEGTWSVNGITGAITFDPEVGFTGNPTPIYYTVLDDEMNESNQALVTVEYTSCVPIEAWVYLEGAAVAPDGSSNYSIPMRTTLNDLRILPGQYLQNGLLGNFYTPSDQPYDVAPWNYSGNEGLGYDSEEMISMADAGYPSTVVDWVLVSLRDKEVDIFNLNGGYKPTETPICTAAALLHMDGSIEFIDGFECCELNVSESYYIVIEHRNHLLVASHEPVSIVNGKISYDFRSQQSYIQIAFGSPNGFGQKEILPGVFAMHAGNGGQAPDPQADTDINLGDEFYLKSQYGQVLRYRNGDYNMNGSPNNLDRILWGFNNGKSSAVPRN